MKKIISIILSIVILFTVLPMNVFATENEAKPINLHKLDGEALPIHEVKGLPNNVGDCYWHTDLEGDYTLVSGDIDNKYFIAYSKDNENFITSYFDINDLNIDNSDEIVYVDMSEIEYFKGAYYISCSIHEKDDNSYVNLRTEYIKTSDFVNWSLVQTAPSQVVTPKIDIDGYEIPTSLLGEYNGVYIAANTYYATLYDEKTEKCCLEYYVSSDGKSWTKKQTPYMNVSSLKGYAEDYFETIGFIEVTSVGVLFYIIESPFVVGGVTVRDSFSDYYITKDFSNYAKLDLSALGKCKSEISDDKKQFYYDEISLHITLVDNVLILFRQHGRCNVLDDGYSEEVLNNYIELYKLDNASMKFELCDEFNDIFYYNYAFITENNYIFSYTKLHRDKSYLYVKENDSKSYIYEWNDLNTLEFEFNFFVEEELDSNGIAKFKYLIGVKDKQKLIVTDNLFKTTYEISLNDLADDIYIECGTKDESGVFVYCYKEINDEAIKTYYYINYDEVAEYIDSQMPDEPDYNYTFCIQEPSRTEIRYKDGIILHVNIEGTAPEGSYVEWSASDGKFRTTEMDDGNALKIVSDSNGKTIFTATLYSANGEVLAIDTVEMKSKAGLFDKIFGFFRSYFGTTKIYEY